MELWRVAIPVERGDDTRPLLAPLRDLRVPMNPCAGEPRFETDNAGRRRLLVIARTAARGEDQTLTMYLTFDEIVTQCELLAEQIFAWIPSVMCTINQLVFRIRHCREGSDNPCREL